MEDKINIKKTIFNVLKVASSNILNLLSGVLVGLIIPMILNTEDYGYYKTFTLYASYVGLFHFGIEDGIYLIYGGKSFGELEKTKFRFYSLFLIVLESLIAIIIMIGGILFLSPNLKFIFACVAIYLLATNISNYYQFISQITSRFNELSIINTIKSVLIICSVLALYALTKTNFDSVSFKTYTIMYVLANCIITVIYIFIYRKITFGKKIEQNQGKKDIFNFFKVGCPLLVANLCSTLILTIDRQFVNVLFDITTYGVYAFAYSMLSLITTAISAISVVLYPTLKQTNLEVLKKSYAKLVTIILCIVFGSLLIYFPLNIFIHHFLPKYNESLPIFKIIFPGLAVSSAITIIMHNYYKALGINFKFFVKSVIILVLSFIMNLVSFLIFRNTISISIASIITMIIWYIYIESYLIKHYKVSWKSNFIYMILMMISFYGITSIDNLYISFAIYLAIYLIITFLFFHRYIPKKKKN